MAATYASQNNALLGKELLFRALREVVRKHAALSIVMHDEPSDAKQGDHRSWEARLKKLNLLDCVSFIDGHDTFTNGLQEFLQISHNEWFDVQDRTKPLWRLVVVNKTHLIFVFHHFIADGSSGVNFHHTLLSALNNISESDTNSSSAEAFPSPPEILISNMPLPPRGLELLSEQFSSFMILLSAVNMIRMLVLRVFIAPKYWLFPEVKFDRSLPSARKPPSMADRPVTKVQRLCLSQTTIVSCLQMCRSQRVSFTAMIYTLISITLAVDIYPEAKINSCNTLISLRRFVQRSQKDLAESHMTNITSGFFYRPWLSAYRAAEMSTPTSTTSNKLPKTRQQPIAINQAAFWNLARQYKAELDSRLKMPRPRTSPVVQDALSLSRLMPPDEEPFADAVFSTMKTVLPNCFALSNLGAIDPNPSGPGGWSISNMEFSVASYGTGVAPILYFAIVSVKGGACVVNVDYQEGKVGDNLVKGVISGIERRLSSILETN